MKQTLKVSMIDEDGQEWVTVETLDAREEALETCQEKYAELRFAASQILKQDISTKGGESAYQLLQQVLQDD